MGENFISKLYKHTFVLFKSIICTLFVLACINVPSVCCLYIKIILVNHYAVFSWLKVIFKWRVEYTYKTVSCVFLFYAFKWNRHFWYYICFSWKNRVLEYYGIIRVDVNIEVSLFAKYLMLPQTFCSHINRPKRHCFRFVSQSVYMSFCKLQSCQ